MLDDVKVIACAAVGCAVLALLVGSDLAAWIDANVGAVGLTLVLLGAGIALSMRVQDDVTLAWSLVVAGLAWIAVAPAVFPRLLIAVVGSG